MGERLFLYKVTSDAGGAPCAQDGILTLAICKPKIRSSAVEGDWLFGIGGVGLDNRLIYIAKVTRKVVNGDYYRLPEYARRRDCIYSWNPQGTSLSVRRYGARYHTDGMLAERDVGQPPNYRNANVLVSEGAFRYLGQSGEALDKNRYQHLVALLALMKQGHRVNHSQKTANELRQLQANIFKKFQKGFTGMPSHPIPDTNGVCSCGERRSLYV